MSQKCKCQKPKPKAKKSKKQPAVSGRGTGSSLSISMGPSAGPMEVNYADTQAYTKLNTNILRSLTKLATDMNQEMKQGLPLGLSAAMTAEVKRTFIARCRTKSAKSAFKSSSQSRGCYTKATLNKFPMQVSATKLDVSANPDPRKQAAFCDTLLKVVNNLYTKEDKYFKQRITLALTGLKRVFSTAKLSPDRTPAKVTVRQISVRKTKTRGNTPKQSSSRVLALRPGASARQLALRAKTSASSSRKSSSRVLALRPGASARQVAKRSGSAKSRSRSSASNSRSWRLKTVSASSNRSSMNPSFQSPSLNAMGMQLQPSASNSQSLEADCTGDLTKDAKAIAKTMKAGLKNCADETEYTADQLKEAIIAAL